MKSAELCAGYGGLALAIEQVFNAETAWVSEFEEAPSKILAHHWPDAPNYGDMTKINWYGVEPVDVLGAGTHCQDLSHAGRRKGMTEGTRSNLWVHMREAIAIIKPTYVVWENVRGAYSAKADSDLEFCPGCMGDTGDERAVLRALGRVLGDLSDLGYDTQWRGLRAADVGACHGRFRVFVLARLRSASHDSRSVRRLEAVQHHGRGTKAINGAGLPNEPDSHIVRSGPIGAAPPAYRDRFGHEWPRDSRGRWTRLENDGFTTADTASARRAEGQDRGASSCDASQGARRGEPERVGGERTLAATDTLSGGHERRGGKRSTELLLNGQVKALHGASTDLPSDAGNESSEGELPGQLRVDDGPA